MSTDESALWEFWIDVGGTFTDCLARSPAGAVVRRKFLSSAICKGVPAAGSTPLCIVDPQRRDDPPDFWQGWRLVLCDANGDELAAAQVRSSGGNPPTLALDAPLAADVAAAASYELQGPFEAPVLAIRHVLGLRPDQTPPPLRLRLGTTRGTNALLTRSGARTALATTRGFGDLLEIGYQDRPRLFDLTVVKTPPLAERTVEIEERLAADGTVLRPVDEVQTRRQLAELRTAGFRALAICLLHADRYPEHEMLVERWALEAGFDEVSRSSLVAPLAKIVARAETTVVDAYLNPVLRTYLARLQRELPGAAIRLMTSAGGLTEPAAFRGHHSVLSGPAGGVVGYARASQAAGYRQAIGFDMGGTSTDVSRFAGEFELQFESQKAGMRLMTPTLAIDTVAAGGGSVCWFDGVKLAVGPHSAGADPGPACYGRGGPLCVTDLNAYLGRLPAEHFPFQLQRAAIERRLDELASQVAAAGERLSREQLAEGLLQIANANMARAIRNVTVAKGYQPADYVLVAFGGAGAQHACAVAEQLGISEVLDPPDAGILSAAGIGQADVVRHAAQGLGRLADATSSEELDALFAQLAVQPLAELRAEGFAPAAIELQRSLDVRYQGVEATLNVPYTGDDQWQTRFLAAHQRQFGYLHRHKPLEAAVARVAAIGPAARLAAPSERRPRRVRTSPRTQHGWFGGAPCAAQVWRRDELDAGDVVLGPALIAGAHSSLAVDPGWEAEKLSGGELAVRRVAGAAPGSAGGAAHRGAAQLDDAPEVAQLEIFHNLLAGVAERMGGVLQRTATSVNVKERLDYSCAVFTGDGRLVANAPHVPVHLGAMGATVRAILRDNPDLRPHDVYATNDPYAGGSHLPDLTLVLPVHDAAGRGPLFFTAVRAHHAEIGGVRPGSMPPTSRELGEEGVVISNFRWIRDGQADDEALRALLAGGPYPTRALADNLADLHAQLAAAQQGAEELQGLAATYGAERVLRQMDAIQTAAEAKVRQAVARLPTGVRRCTDWLETAEGESVPIAVEVEVSPPGLSVALRIDFTGSAPVCAGNLNANPAIVSAAVLYVLRLLIDEDIPLNEGALRAVDVHVPQGLLHPPPAAERTRSPAVAAGNVETSQRIVDVLLSALELAACSQGTMNNLIFGNAQFGCYETICGGAGATAAGPGADAVQVHMTNTRATDPEILERRLPVRLHEFAVRRGSGGAGRHRGGHGAVRRLEFLTHAELSWIAQRRGPHPPRGCAGGQPGALGRNRLVRRDGSVVELPGIGGIAVEPGDQIVIETPGGGGYGAG